MKRRHVFTLVAGVALLTLPASMAGATTLYSDDFDTDTSANYVVNQTEDAAVTFAYDYSADGIPSAPNSSGGTTLGVKFEANLVSPASADGITIAPIGQSFSGKYAVTFDMWINANGPFPGGGTGSTEFLTAGIGYDGSTVNRGGATGSGGWFAVTGEGGSARDYRAYKGSGEQFAESGQFAAPGGSGSGGAQDNSNPYYAATFPSVSPPAAQGQSGSIATGAAGFAWHEVEIFVDESAGTAKWTISGLEIATLNANIGSSFPLAGNISLGYMDIFTSISDAPQFSFGLIDNVKVTAIPEPATLALLGLGLAGLFVVRRRP